MIYIYISCYHDIMFTFYCMKFYQRHHLMSKSFSPPQRHHGVCVTISIYTLVLPIYVLFLCDFTCVVWLMGQLWPFCVNKMTTTTTIYIYICIYIYIYMHIYMDVNLWPSANTVQTTTSNIFPSKLLRLSMTSCDMVAFQPCYVI